MEKLYTKTRRMEEVGITAFILLFLTVGFLQTCSLTFGRSIISMVQWPTIALGCVLVLYRFLHCKHYIRTRGILLLVLFAVSYVLSSLWTFRYGWYENARYLVFMVFMFGLIYATDDTSDRVVYQRRFQVVAAWYLICTAVLSLLSFVFLFAGYTHIFYPAKGEEGPIYYIGFMYGRLFGAYWDPNIAATIAALAILLSVYFAWLTKRRSVRRLCIASAVLQLFYLSFSGSRTGQICLFAGLLVFGLVMALRYSLLLKKCALWLAILATVTTTVVGAFVLPKTILSTSNSVIHYVQTHGGWSSGSLDDKDDLPEDIFDRGYDTSADISNRRFDIWGGAVDIFRTSPVFGVSRANILPYVDDNLPDSYLVTNDHMRFDSMHNMVFEILASQGALGIILFISFVLWTVIGILRKWKALWLHEELPLMALILGVAAATCTGTLVMAEIVYVTSPITILFWLGLGYLNRHVNTVTKEAL